MGGTGKDCGFISKLHFTIIVTNRTTTRKKILKGREGKCERMLIYI